MSSVLADRSSRLIIAAMAVAATILLALGVAFVLGAFEGDEFGPGGTFSGNCREYGTDNLNKASFSDPYLKGVVSVGFNRGPDGPAAAALLKTLGTTYYMPIPFRDFAFVCVQEGHEDEWVAKLKALDWVEFAHKEGVTHCQPNCRLNAQ